MYLASTGRQGEQLAVKALDGLELPAAGAAGLQLLLEARGREVAALRRELCVVAHATQCLAGLCRWGGKVVG